MQWHTRLILHLIYNDHKEWRVPGEARDVASEHPDIVERLTNHFQKWKAEMKPQLIADDIPLMVATRP